MNLESRKIRLVMELRSAGITDARVVAALETTPREEFVPETFRDRAYDNVALPIGHEQTISQPLVVARMTQALEPQWNARILEVGTGSGYHATVLARIFRRVYTIERHRRLLKAAEARLTALGITNVTTRAGDGTLGWPEAAPFQRIVVTAAAIDIPPVLTGQLAPGGIMVLPMGHAADQQRLMRVRRTDEGLETEDLGPIRFVPLVEGFPEP